jgi:acyl transferase domain-containing protein
MAAVGLDSDTTSTFLRPGIVIACENSPSSTTISGDEGVLVSVLEEIKDCHRGVLARRLKVDMAYHSHHMEDLSNKYIELLQAKFRSTQCSPVFGIRRLFQEKSSPQCTGLQT